MPAEPDLRNITFPGGGFSVTMLDPLTNYRIAYADAERDFAIEIEHRSVHPPHRFTPGQPPMMSSPHLDQLGHVTGTLTLRGERIPVDCFSIRDRTWGPRGGSHDTSRKPEYQRGEYRVLHPGGPRWREVERQRGRGRIQYMFGHADETTGFLGFLRPQDGNAAGWSPVHVGWLLQDGTFGHLDADRSRMRGRSRRRHRPHRPDRSRARRPRRTFDARRRDRRQPHRRTHRRRAFADALGPR